MALSTSAGLLVATLLAARAVKRVAGAAVPLATLARVLLALGVAIGVAHLLPSPGKVLTLIFCRAHCTGVRAGAAATERARARGSRHRSRRGVPTAALNNSGAGGGFCGNCLVRAASNDW